MALRPDRTSTKTRSATSSEEPGGCRLHELGPPDAVDEVVDDEHVLAADHDVADAHHVRVIQRGEPSRVAHPVADLLVAVRRAALHALDDHDLVASLDLRVDRGARRHGPRAQLAQKAIPLRRGTPRASA